MFKTTKKTDSHIYIAVFEIRKLVKPNQKVS